MRNKKLYATLVLCRHLITQLILYEHIIFLE